MEISESQQQLMIVAIPSPSSKKGSLRDVYFKQLTQNLELDIFAIVNHEIQDQNDKQLQKLISNTVELGNLDSLSFLEQEQMKYRKASLERIHHKQGIAIQKDIEKKLLMNKDLAVLDLSNYSPHYKQTNPPDGEARQQSSKSVTEGAQECKTLVKKLNEEKREREKKKQEKLRMEQEKLQKEIEERQRKLEEDKNFQQMEKDKKREEIEKKIQNRIQSREMSQKRMAEETKKISKKPKMYMEIEKKYTDEATKENERQRLEKLKEIKEKHQPLNKDDIESHARKYEEVIRQKKEELRIKRGGLDYNYESSDQQRNYKSKFYLEMVEGEKEVKELRGKEKVEKKRLADKANSYAKYVKEMYWPQASEDKRQQLESMKENLRHPVRKTSEEDPQITYQQRRNIMRHGTADNKLAQKPKQYSVRNQNTAEEKDSSRGSQKNFINGFSSEPEQIPEEPRFIVRKKKQQLKPFAQINKQPDQSDQKPPPKDYLREFKSKRDQDVKRNQITDLDKVLKSQNLSDAEKYSLVKLKTDQLEQKAEQEEKMLSVIGSHRNVDRHIEVNDMYIESIKAKLKMLDQI